MVEMEGFRVLPAQPTKVESIEMLAVEGTLIKAEMFIGVVRAVSLFVHLVPCAWRLMIRFLVPEVLLREPATCVA